jgi:hypothetical protein
VLFGLLRRRGAYCERRFISDTPLSRTGSPHRVDERRTSGTTFPPFASSARLVETKNRKSALDARSVEKSERRFESIQPLFGFDFPIFSLSSPPVSLFCPRRPESAVLSPLVKRHDGDAVPVDRRIP